MTTDAIVQLSWRKRTAIRSLFSKSLFDRSALTLWIALGVGAMTFMVAGMYVSFEETLAEFDMGAAMEAFLYGSDIATPVGWITAEVYSMVAPFAIVVLAVLDGARSFAGEEEDRSVGMLGSNPLSRTRIVADKSLAIAIHVVLLAAITALFLWLGAIVFGLDLDVGAIWAANLHLAMLGLMFAGATVLASAGTGRRVQSMLIVAAIAGVSYIGATFVPIIEGWEGWARLSPWHYFYGDNPLANGVNWGHIAVMSAITLATFLAGWWVYTKRDLPG